MSTVQVEFDATDITVEFIDATNQTLVEALSNVTVEFTDTPHVVEFAVEQVTVDTTTTVTEVVVEHTNVTVELPQRIVNDVSGLDLDLINAGFPSTTFIYNSSGSQTGTRFNSWSDLMSAIALTQYGGPRNILFEQDETIPAGTYDLTDITLLGNGIGITQSATLTIAVTFDDGCTLTNDILRGGNGITMVYGGTGYLMDGTDDHEAAKQIILSDRASAITSVLATGAFVGLGSSGATNPCSGELQIVMAKGEVNAIGGDGFGFNPLVRCLTDVAGTRGIVIVDNAEGSIFIDSFIAVDGANNASVTIYQNSSTTDVVFAQDVFTTTAAGPGPGVLNTPTISIGSNATRMAYTPTTAGDWGSSVPTTIQEALDTLAANTTIP